MSRSMNQSVPPTLRVCIEHEQGCYVAQCVDYDLSGSGESPDAAVDAFIRAYMKLVLAAVSVGSEPFCNIPPAPPEYVERWRADVQRGHGVMTRRIPRFTVVKQGQHVPADYFGSVEASVPAEAA